MQVTQAPGQDPGSISIDSSSSVIGRTRPLVNKIVARNVTRPKIRRPLPPKLGLFHPNATKVLPGGRRFLPDSLHKKAMVLTKGEQPGIDQTKPYVQTIQESLTDHSEETSSSARGGNKSPAVMPENDFETNGESSSEEPSNTGSKGQPDSGIAEAENHTDSVSSEPTGSIQSQGKKCMNKVRIIHSKLPLKNRADGCREDEIGLRENALRSRTGEIRPTEEKDLDYTPDPLHKLITDTFDDLNITTISVHLARPQNLSADAEIVRKQILKGFPLLLPSSTLSARSSYLSSKTSSPAAQPPSSPTDTISSSDLSLLSPSSTKSSLSLPSPSSSSISLNDLHSNGSNELDSSSHSESTEDSELPSSEQRDITPFHHTPRGSIRHIYPNFDLLRNKTRPHVKVPIHSHPHLNHTLIKETKNASSSPSLSASRNSPSMEVNLPMKDGNREEDRITKGTTGVEEGQKKILTERRKIPFRRLPLKGTYPRRLPLHLQNRTQPISRHSTQPSQSFNLNTDTPKQQRFPTELAKNSTSISSDSVQSFPVPISEGNEGRTGTRLPEISIANKFNQNPRERVVPSSRQSDFYQLHQNGHSVQNKTFMNLRHRHNPHRGVMRRPFLGNKQHGGTIADGSQPNKFGKHSAGENPESQTGNQNIQRGTHGYQSNQSKQSENDMLRQNALKYEPKITASKQTKQLDNGDNTLIQAEASTDSDSKERYDTDRDNGATNLSRTFVKPNFKPSRLVTIAKKQPTSRTIIGQHRGTQSINGAQKKQFQKTNTTAKTVFDTETEGTEDPTSEVSSEKKREPLDFVGVTNKTSDGFTVIWDSPQGKYKNFVINRTEVEREESPKHKKEKQEEDEDQYTKKLSENGGDKDNNKLPEDFQVPNTQIGTVDKTRARNKTIRQVLPGSARSLQFEHLPPQTEYTITLLGKGPGILSRLHKLVISTGTNNGDR